MDFENDVFISYAHLDNQAVIEGQSGWISKFDRALKIRLGQLLGREPRIWRDPKLQGNDFRSRWDSRASSLLQGSFSALSSY